MWYVCVEIDYISVNRTFLLTNTVQILSHDILRDALKLQGYMFWWLKCSNNGRLGDDVSHYVSMLRMIIRTGRNRI